MRPLCFFALGDQTEPVRGLVIEVPAPAADNRKFPQQKKLGPLGWLYSYARVTGASIDGEYDKAALQRILLGLFAYGTPAA